MKRSATIAMALAALLVACNKSPQSATGPVAEPVLAAARAGGTLGWINSAQASAVSSQSTTKGVECFVGGFDFPTVPTRQSHLTTSGSGHITLQCHGQLPPGTAPSQVVVERGFPCGMPNGMITTNTREVITPSGRVNLFCRI